ncbi:biotin transporter BioY [Bacillus massiliigorillae]|uniref:biotin transporter BioY n=1 Tax=Bacillus massiliigorillae TaxID=1243664 RepID=UPI0003A7CDE8|nr:biotin transporter BioY [Bacillus massiliigorillae]
MKKDQLKFLIVTALFAAIIGLLAQITIPLPLIPITGQTFAIGLASTILGARYGTLSVLLYIFLGIAGVPVFSAMTSGLGIVLGPTGGYIVGFIPAAFIIGLYIEKTKLNFMNAMIANTLGMIITLLFGTAWLKFSGDLSWTTAFISGTLPFLIVGLIKAALASYLGVIVRNRLMSARLLPHYSTKM